MPISPKLLNEGERIVVSTRTHPKALLLPILALVLFLALGVAVQQLVGQEVVTLVGWVIAVLGILRFTVWPTLDWLTSYYAFTDRRLITRTGVLTRRAPSDAEAGDIAYGVEVAGEVARLDLGQTIVVKDRAVVAVEAMEGTDATIRRAGELARRPPLTVVKVAKPNQDMRFDVPVIGPGTIRTMVDARATALSITAHKTLLIDRDELLALANKARITIVATPEPASKQDP